MTTLAIRPGLLASILLSIQEWRRRRDARRVELYRIYVTDSTRMAYADAGDEDLVERYVGRMLREGASGVVIDRVEMSRAEARALPVEKRVG